MSPALLLPESVPLRLCAPNSVEAGPGPSVSPAPGLAWPSPVLGHPGPGSTHTHTGRGCPPSPASGEQGPGAGGGLTPAGESPRGGFSGLGFQLCHGAARPEPGGSGGREVLVLAVQRGKLRSPGGRTWDRQPLVSAEAKQSKTQTSRFMLGARSGAWGAECAAERL